ncbi:MAG TPA: hypothetical protein DF383_01970 [Deltaproteobacteria bacterium]|nr:hypothetical protein [Deltaproteobacteria bacterium]
MESSMKAAKFYSLLFLVFLLGCGGGGSSGNDMISVDPTLVLGDDPEILNETLKDRPLGIIYSSDEGKLAVVTNRLIIDPVDENSLNQILQKYHATVVSDPDIPLPETTILDENGAHSGGTTYRLLEIDPTLGKDGYYSEYLRKQGTTLAISVDSEATKGFLNLLGQMYLEDQKKLRDIQVAAYAAEAPISLLKNLQFPLEDWATCRCLGKDDNGALQLRAGATWNDEIRSAPVYNSLLVDRSATPPKYCTYNDGFDARSDRFLTQGDNVLIADFATFYSNHEKNNSRLFNTGPVGNMHLWAFPKSLLPIELPSTLDSSPPGSVHVILKGPAEKDKCEWWSGEVDQYIAYQNVILWDWDRAPGEDVALFLWEGDECQVYFLGIRICNPDDKIAMLQIARDKTTGPNGLLIRDIDASSPGIVVQDMSKERDFDIRIQTIDYCRADISGDGLNIHEICNGYDDTCDGKIDEGYEAKGSTCDNGGIGQCKSVGKLICNNPDSQKKGAPALICNAAPRVASPFEICDGIDNDCDGQTDENWLQEGLACGLSVGTCGVGALGCTNGHISCEGEIAATAEICDGLDNDCDGVSDEGCACTPGTTRACSIDVGPCTLGTQDCLPNGTWSESCSGVVPQPEVCDGIDNNCNGAVDEGVLNRCGTCGPEPVEVCDGIDNDCDGEVDEGVTNSCGGCWEEGPEICDGLDNDCDGIIDEADAPITCGVGVCQRSVDSVCEDCIPGPADAPSESFQNHTCDNGVDDDCDGMTDLNDYPDCIQIQGGGG